MATYIPGVQDYIPQFQPFQPDYNFLGNILQTKQSQYDANYKQLSKKYGTLLNSDMLRTDNIEKRNEFFKMIDQDIKKISGLDLSLEQNVDSANKVFDSFFQNKDMVHDMNYTREYQKQLGIAEQYKHCMDQNKCGGYYWEKGVNYLNYKADEFKKASSQDAMKMSPGSYVPQINLQEKATNYLKDLLGKDGGGGFGVQNITKTKDGRYNITTTNGANLVVPYQQLLQATYGKDQRIIDMFNVEAYVNRKSYVSQNAEALGSEDAAEDKYFQMLDKQYQTAQQKYIAAIDQQNKSRTRQKLLAKEIQTKGSDGKDGLAKDYVAASTDVAISDQIVDIHGNTVKVGESYFKAGEDRITRRQRADQLYASSLMDKEIDDSAIRAAAMTGSVKMEADPYAKSYYDHSLQMSEIAARANYEDRNNLNNAKYQLNKEALLYKFKSEYDKKGDAYGPSNVPRYVDAHPGTTAIQGEEMSKDIAQKLATEVTSKNAAAAGYVNGYGNTLVAIAGSQSASAEEQKYAKWALASIYGQAVKGSDGKYRTNGYDPVNNVFVDKSGQTFNSADKISSEYNIGDLFGKAKKEADLGKNITSHAAFLSKDGAKFMKEYEMHADIEKTTSDVWKENNKGVASYGSTKLGGTEKRDFNLLFDGNYNLRDKASFIKEYQSKVGGDLDDAEDAYEDANSNYNKYYNSGNPGGKDASGNAVPIVKSTSGASMLGYFGGGKTAGGALQFDFSSENPGSLGSRGMLTLFDDANTNVNSIWAVGDHADLKSAKNSMDKDGTNARLAMSTFINDLRTGNLTKTEKDMYLGQVLYMDVAAGDASKVGMTVKLPASWLARYKGSDKKPKWADDINLATQGVSVYTDKASAQNEFTKAVKAQPMDYLLNFKPVKIKYDNGGEVTINPRASDGSYTVVGTTFGYFYDNKGQLKKQEIPVSKTYMGDVGGARVYSALDAYFGEIDKANDLFINSNGRQQLEYDPNKLPEVRRYLDVMAGGSDENASMNIEDLNKMFIKSLQTSLFSSNQ